MKTRYTALALAVAVMTGQAAIAGEAEAKKWIDHGVFGGARSGGFQLCDMFLLSLG